MTEYKTNLDRIPLKSRLLLLFKEAGDQGLGCIEATNKLLEVENMKATQRWKFVIRFYMMEMEVNGMLIATGQDVAPADYYGQEDVLVCSYKITKLGIERIDTVVR